MRQTLVVVVVEVMRQLFVVLALPSSLLLFLFDEVVMVRQFLLFRLKVQMIALALRNAIVHRGPAVGICLLIGIIENGCNTMGEFLTEILT